MSNYTIAAVDLKKLYGAQFYAADLGGGRKVSFEIYDKVKARPRTGMEAYGLLLDCNHPALGKIPSFLKIFKKDIPERRERTEALIRMGLARSHPWLFQGVPYAWLPGTSVNGIGIVGHVAHQIGARYGAVGEDFSRLKNQQLWGPRYSLEARKTFAAQLCCAVAAIEKIGLVHGDLSGGNIMLSAGPDGEEICTLCDFDGYYHKLIEPLPRRFDGLPCRPLGSSGYQYPELLARIEHDAGGTDPSVLVATDRFALGAIVCELLIWSSNVEGALGRTELLSTNEIKSKSLKSLPKSVAQMWPEGLSLLETGLKAGSISDFPAPEDWLSTLGVQLWDHEQFKGKPYLEFYRRSGSRVKLMGKADIAQNLNGNFGAIAPELAQLGYGLDGGRLTVHVPADAKAFIIRGDRSHGRGVGPVQLKVNPGEAVVTMGWEVRIFDGLP